MERSVEGFLKTAEGLDTDLLEVRADGLSECSPENIHNLISELKKTTKAKLILTVRQKNEGGFFKGTEEERKKAILGSLHLTDLIDIELRSGIREEVVSKARANKIETIISYHDFDKTPSRSDIIEIINEETKAGADYAKVAFTATSLHDVLELLQVTMEMSKKTRVITISMGELGSISRVVAPLLGSEITYASAGKKTAPGQLSVEETKKVLGILEAAK
jgi:3-dehydroquinate dehydratase-1